MSLPPNIDRFNKAALLVFDTLYLSFPVPIELDAKKIAADTLPADAEFEDSFAAIEPVYYTIEFLKREGFVDYSDAYLDGTAFLQARLTSKSLALLGQTPSILEPQTSISDSIRKVVKGGLREASSEVVKKAVDLVFANAPQLLSLTNAAAAAAQ